MVKRRNAEALKVSAGSSYAVRSTSEPCHEGTIANMLLRIICIASTAAPTSLSVASHCAKDSRLSSASCLLSPLARLHGKRHDWALSGDQCPDTLPEAFSDPSCHA